MELVRSLIKPHIQKRSVLKILRFIESLKYLDPYVFNTKKNILRGNRLIYESLNGNIPQAIGKLGSVELASLKKYLRYYNFSEKENVTKTDREILFNNGGVFPPTYEVFESFCNYFLTKVLPEMDYLAVWFNHDEAKISKKYARKSRFIPVGSLETYVSHGESLWTRWLKEKKVLIVHPFKNSIEHQYSRRDLLWNNRNILPEFELKTIAAPHYPSMVKPNFSNWFDALEDLKHQMSLVEFDIALIGAGAYSLPLAVHAKNLGKHGIHIGGALQIYFGIYGKRWEEIPEIKKLKNEFWIRPLKEDTPQNISLVENGCYW